MKAKKVLIGVVVVIIIALLNFLIMNYDPKVDDEWISLEVTLESEQSLQATVFYLTSDQTLTDGFGIQQCVGQEYTDLGQKQTLKFNLPATTQYIRLDPGETGVQVNINEINLKYEEHELVDSAREFTLDNSFDINDETHVVNSNSNIKILDGNSDPYIIWTVSSEANIAQIKSLESTKCLILKIVCCLLVDIICIISWKKKNILLEVPKEIIANRKLIMSLAVNDFKTKFAGSYFGIIWAFVQPIVTVLVYWFVFEKALSAGAQTTKAGIAVPYVLWLIAGLVPWFFFSEVLNTGTNALIEYSYLVKKVVFKISILPVVKIVSSLFVHLFFIGFTLILYSCYQYYPTVYMLQLFYYSFCMIMLCMGLIYATSAIVIFFRDLSQVINIILQVGMWVTPIMWNMDAMAAKVSGVLLSILKLNPMYYIVSGYRDALINQVWFWDRPEITLYFWLFVIIVFGIGFTIFRRLQIHFADVL